jgi:hypothetical protein
MTPGKTAAECRGIDEAIWQAIHERFPEIKEACMSKPTVSDSLIRLYIDVAKLARKIKEQEKQ